MNLREALVQFFRQRGVFQFELRNWMIDTGNAVFVFLETAVKKFQLAIYRHGPNAIIRALDGPSRWIEAQFRRAGGISERISTIG